VCQKYENAHFWIKCNDHVHGYVVDEGTLRCNLYINKKANQFEKASKREADTRIQIQSVQMKGIQNKKFISRELIVVHVSGLCHRKGKL
jgi:hypothetical protein